MQVVDSSKQEVQSGQQQASLTGTGLALALLHANMRILQSNLHVLLQESNMCLLMVLESSRDFQRLVMSQTGRQHRAGLLHRVLCLACQSAVQPSCCRAS